MSADSVSTGDKPLPMIEFARHLRRRSTGAEIKLWRALRDRKLRGFKFRRQHPVSPYVLDFYCHDLGLALELDGSSHLSAEQREHDQRRTAFLLTRGIRVYRLGNYAVLREHESLVDHLWVLVTKLGGLKGAEAVGDEEIRRRLGMEGKEALGEG